MNENENEPESESRLRNQRRQIMNTGEQEVEHNRAGTSTEESTHIVCVKFY